MTRFVEEAIARAGLLPVLTARRGGDIDSVRGALASWRSADLLALGAVADLVRSEDEGTEVRIHESNDDGSVLWIDGAASELDVLREVAVARISSERGTRIGVDWGKHGLELAQVALGFGATDLRGPITRKSGLPILEDETKKVKGQGMVDLRSLMKRELSDLVRYAGRLPVFVGEQGKRSDVAQSTQEVAGA